MIVHTLGTRGFSRVRRFSVLAEGRHVFGQKPETALEKSLAPRVDSPLLYMAKYGYTLEVLIEKRSAAVSCDANRTKAVGRTVEQMNSFLLKSIT